MFLCGRFGNSTSGAGPDILVDILSKFWLIEIFLHQCYHLFNAKVSCHPTVVSFPNNLHALTWWNTKMDHMAQQLVLKMEISDSCVWAKHLVGFGEVRICLIEVGPSRGIVDARVALWWVSQLEVGWGNQQLGWYFLFYTWCWGGTATNMWTTSDGGHSTICIMCAWAKMAYD